MIANLLCKSVIPRSKLYRPFVHHAENIGDACLPKSCYDPSCVSMGWLEFDPVSGILFPYLTVQGPGPLHASSCNVILENCLELELTPRIAAPFLAQFILRGAVPDLHTFSLITNSYCKQFKYQRVLDALAQMKALQVEINDSFYRNLVERVCASFGPVVTYDLLKKMRASHRVEMPLSCYNFLVPQFFKKQHLRGLIKGDVFVKVMYHMKRHRVFPDQNLIDAFFKARYIYDTPFKKAEGIARQMFAEGIKVGVVQRRKRYLKLSETPNFKNNS